MNISNRLQNIFRDIFDDESIVLTRNSSPGDIEDWDSLAQVNIIVACESEFGVKFDMNDITGIRNAGNMIDLIERKLKQ